MGGRSRGWAAGPLPLPLLLAGLLQLGAAAQVGRWTEVEISLPPGDNITVFVKRGTLTWPTNLCNIIFQRRRLPSLIIKRGEKAVFTFECSDPEKHYVLEVQKNIDCMSGPCPFGEVQLLPSRLPALNRTFIWNVKASPKVGLELQFSSPRLQQIRPGETCPDLVTYSISSSVEKTAVNIGTFCSNGTVSRIKMQGGVKLALYLPWNENRNFSGFNITNRSSIRRLCIIESVFEGEGSATLMSANYPDGFPEDELMSWQFVIPPHLRASVSFLNYTLSNCEKKEERVEYFIPGSLTNPEVFQLGDKQPGNMAGNFNLSLQGCDQDFQNPGALRLLFQVLVQYPQSEGNKVYTVNLSNERAMSLSIEPRPLKTSRRFVPACLICEGPTRCSSNLTLTSGNKYEISFLCDDLTRLWIIAEKSISCTDIGYCSRKSYQLLVPSDIIQLPVELRDYTWKLFVPKDKISLQMSPAQKLQQHTHDKNCETTFSYMLSSAVQGQNLYFGSFCPGGSIEKIQVKTNISVVLRTFSPGFFNESFRQGMNVTFIPSFKDEGIFTVTPDSKAKVYLRTPNWDRGLPPLTSVSWNISVPHDQVAHLTFSKERMGVSCETGRAFMIIQEQKAKAEEIVSRDDEPLPKPRDLHHNFWVNISNCSPMQGKQLDLQFCVSLTPRKMDMMVIILAAVGGGSTLLFALGLLICYAKKSKNKKDSKEPAVGIYNGNINTQIPGKAGKFQKGRKENDSHVYAVIDDTMVYGHLLNGSNGSSTSPEVDVYRPFQGPMGDRPPSPPPICSRISTKKLHPEDPRPFLLSESDGEPYTFSHPKTVALKGNEDNGIPLLEKKEPEEVME
ncbi:CUB domain-containing protein 1 [Sarcophilus harrisii]|uniref:CUB domain containing protein 1 n=1 Tax=Sarcophilus harrisii TaxID=9305 RepID=G3VSQ2_SARHA|nr:CUB domain-containing protein 1 [Sarcophilus harrisii]